MKSKPTIYLAVATIAVAVSWPAAAEIAVDQSSLRPFESQLPDFGRLNRARTTGASLVVSRAIPD